MPPKTYDTTDIGPGTLYEEGAATEDPLTAPPGIDSLPPGVHPNDPTTAADPVAAPPDTPGSRAPTTGKPPWGTETDQALPVFQRGNHDWTANPYIVDANNGSTLELTGRVKGKRFFRIRIPSTTNVPTALPAVIGPTEGEVLTAGLGSGIIIYPGDPWLTLETEASIWAGLVGANVTGGPIQVVIETNPPGGGLGTWG